MYNSPIFITTIALIGLIDLIMLPFMLWSVYRFYTIRMHPEINARYYIIILSQSLFNIFEICIRNQYLLIIGLNSTQIVSHTPPTWIGMINECLYLIIPMIILYRTWLTNFNINYTFIQKQRDWQILLIDNKDNDKDWYSLNKHRYGDWKWLLKFIFIPLFFILSFSMLFIMIVFKTYRKDINYIYNSIIFLFLYIPIIYIYIKTPTFEDTFFIKRELSLLIKCIICYQIIYLILIHWTYLYIIKILQIFTIILMNFTIIIISHHWVIKQINKNLTEYKSANRSSKIYTINTERYRLPSLNGRVRSHSVEQRILGNKRIFNVLIANKIGINYFFNHLINEFSCENLLFFIEIIQWIYNVINNNWNKYDTSPLGIITFELTNIVPISSINSNTNNNWYIKLKQIHKKYIDSSSEYQINLPYNIQNGFINLFTLYDIKIGIENGTFKPKTKRKKHHKNIGMLGSKNIKDEIKKQTPAMIDINLPKERTKRSKSYQQNIKPATVTTTINMDRFPKKAPEFIMASNTADNVIINKKVSMIPNVSTNLQRQGTFVVHETVDSNSMDSWDEEQQENNNEQIGNELTLNDIPTQPRNTLSIMNGLFDEVMDEKLPESNLSVMKTNSTMFSRISGLFEFNSVIMHKDAKKHVDVGIDREMAIEEQIKMENAKKLSVNDFISLSCNAIYNILQLNYQSVARFKKTKKWDEFQEQVNWQDLLKQYGEKGCIAKKMAKLM